MGVDEGGCEKAKQGAGLLEKEQMNKTWLGTETWMHQGMLLECTAVNA